MFKGFVIGVLATVGIGLVVAYQIVTTGALPANADGEPLPFEVWAATTSLNATVGREAPKDANPVALSDENLIAGIKLYGDNCAFCHGDPKGAATATTVAKGEYPAPPQFAANGVENDSEGATFWKIKHGIRLSGMPSWKGGLTDQQIWTLALFLKHMDKLPPAAQAAWQKVQN